MSSLCDAAYHFIQTNKKTNEQKMGDKAIVLR